MSKRVLCVIAVLTRFSSQAESIFTRTDLISGENPFDHSQVWTASINVDALRQL